MLGTVAAFAAHVMPTLLAGGILGVLSAIAVQSLQHRSILRIKVLDNYFAMRTSVIDFVADLANLALRHSLDPDNPTQWRDTTSRLFYLHYDLLPRTVLNELICLFIALGDKQGRTYGVDGDTIVPLSAEAIEQLIDSISFYRNTRIRTALMIASEDGRVRYNAAVNLHARRVLLAFDAIFTGRALLNIGRSLRKPLKSDEPLRLP
jgi:hypothetical protein